MTGKRPGLQKHRTIRAHGAAFAGLAAAVAAALAAASCPALAAGGFSYAGTVAKGDDIYSPKIHGYKLGSENGSFSFKVDWDYRGNPLYG